MMKADRRCEMGESYLGATHRHIVFGQAEGNQCTQARSLAMAVLPGVTRFGIAIGNLINNDQMIEKLHDRSFKL